jgi:hypothetical protein
MSASKRKLSALGVGIVLAMALVVGPASSHVPTPTGNQGCTPGFWKNNTKAWESTAPNVYPKNTRLESAFNNVPDHLDNKTFLEALKFQGNVGPEGRLLRHAVAALLNTVHFDVAYQIGDESILKSMVNAALAGSKADMEALSSQLDRWNNAGCPLSAKIDY